MTKLGQMKHPQSDDSQADDKPHYDVVIIGGGINGCGIARELAAKGYSVYLAEARDLSSGTSSWSTKLIHGGLRYLEHYEFRLVREALRERETLMKMAPHLIHPLRFILPHLPSMRPKWLLRLGLFLYDNLGGRQKLAGSHSINLKQDEAGRILKPEFTSAFEYSDCFVDDNRLTILNARAAQNYGAVIQPYNAVLSAQKTENGWQIKTEKQSITASLIINAAGPWADQVRSLSGRSSNDKKLRLVRGSHIITDKKFDHDRAYIFQNSDGRILFAIPYLDDYTLFGTPDVDHEDSPDAPEISDAEIDYICAEVSHYLKQAITPEDVRFTYSGVRPLYDDGASQAQSATRDYVLGYEEDTNDSWLNIFGGKLTTYRKLAKAVSAKIENILPAPSNNEAGASYLPGGNMANGDFSAFLTSVQREFPTIDDTRLRRMAKAYGTEIYSILGNANEPADEGIDFGCGLYQAEVDFLIAHEWAKTADDILMRRSKLGYQFNDQQRRTLSDYLASHPALS